MTPKIFTVIATLALAATSAALASDGSASKAAAEVAYNEPENFTDFRRSEHYTKADAQSLERELSRAIERSAGSALPPGYTLSIRFTDIDLAGDVNPYQRIEMRDVREYRSVYPPRLSFDYAVKDTEGNVVLSGSERLVDMAYDMRLRMPNSDYTRIEAELMRDFISDVARKLNKAAA